MGPIIPRNNLFYSLCVRFTGKMVLWPLLDSQRGLLLNVLRTNKIQDVLRTNVLGACFLFALLKACGMS